METKNKNVLGDGPRKKLNVWGEGVTRNLGHIKLLQGVPKHLY